MSYKLNKNTLKRSLKKSYAIYDHELTVSREKNILVSKEHEHEIKVFLI